MLKLTKENIERYCGLEKFVNGIRVEVKPNNGLFRFKEYANADSLSDVTFQMDTPTLSTIRRMCGEDDWSALFLPASEIPAFFTDAQLEQDEEFAEEAKFEFRDED